MDSKYSLLTAALPKSNDLSLPMREGRFTEHHFCAMRQDTGYFLMDNGNFCMNNGVFRYQFFTVIDHPPKSLAPTSS